MSLTDSEQAKIKRIVRIEINTSVGMKVSMINILNLSTPEFVFFLDLAVVVTSVRHERAIHLLSKIVLLFS